MQQGDAAVWLFWTQMRRHALQRPMIKKPPQGGRGAPPRGPGKPPRPGFGASSGRSERPRYGNSGTDASRADASRFEGSRSDDRPRPSRFRDEAPRAQRAREESPPPPKPRGNRYDPSESDIPYVDFDETEAAFAGGRNPRAAPREYGERSPYSERPRYAERSERNYDAPPLYGDDRKSRFAERPAKPGYSDRPARAERLGKEGPAKAKPVRTEPKKRDEPYWLWGTHAAKAALANEKRKVLKIVATPNGAADLPATWRIDLVTPDALARLLPAGAVHQGIAIEVAPLKDVAVADVLGGSGPIVVLDQVTDPQNVGAIFRSAAAFGARAIVQQDRKSPPITGALAKAAAGAVETIADVRVTNIARALEEMQAAGMQVVGLSSEGTVPLDQAFDGRPAVVVMGAEGKGVRELVAETCDVLARIPIDDAMESLNVSNATALALYEAVRGGPKPAEGVVRAYLTAMEARDLPTAASLLGKNPKLTMPGGETFGSVEEVVDWASGRYSRAFKTIDRVDATGTVVLVQGTLRGEFPDGSVFTGVRFADWFRLSNDKIVDLRVWNDLAEVLPG